MDQSFPRPTAESTRQLLAKKYSSDQITEESSAVANGGAVLIGLLYGRNDFGKTVITEMHCRWDSDCNPATVGALIGREATGDAEFYMASQSSYWGDIEVISLDHRSLGGETAVAKPR